MAAAAAAAAAATAASAQTAPREAARPLMQLDAVTVGQTVPPLRSEQAPQQQPDPLEAMNLGTKEMNMYVADVQDRWRGREGSLASYEQAVRSLMGTLPRATQVHIEEVQSRIKGEVRDMLMPLRSKIYDLAQTLHEIYARGADLEDESQSERVQHMHKAFADVKVDVGMLKDSSLDLLREINNQLVSHEAGNPKWGNRIFIGTAVCLLCACLMAFSAATKKWAVAVWLGLTMAAAASICLLTLGVHRYLAERRRRKALDQIYAWQVDFLRVSQEMLTGVTATVRDLEEAIKLFASIKASDRTERRMGCIMNGQRQLFLMRMATDEYMVWLEMNHYFPHNVSVRALMGVIHYEQIKRTLESAAAIGSTSRPAVSQTEVQQACVMAQIPATSGIILEVTPGDSASNAGAGRDASTTAPAGIVAVQATSEVSSGLQVQAPQR